MLQIHVYKFPHTVRKFIIDIHIFKKAAVLLRRIAKCNKNGLRETVRTSFSSMERTRIEGLWYALVTHLLGGVTDRKWQATFGISPEIIHLIWNVLALYHPGTFEPVDLLWTLYYLRLYPTYDHAALFWNVSSVTFQHRVWAVMEVLYLCLNNISFDRRMHENPWNGMVYGVIDGKFCPIEINRKDWDEQGLFYSGKHKKWGIKYEVVVSWKTGQILWVAGGVRGSVHDVELARTSGIKNMLLPLEALFGDKGYIGEPGWIFTPYKGRSADLTLTQRAWNLFLNPVRVIVENALGRICKFKILQEPFRGGHNFHDRVALHKVVMKVLCEIAWLDIEVHPLRSDVRADPEMRYRDPDSDLEE